MERLQISSTAIANICFAYKKVEISMIPWTLATMWWYMGSPRIANYDLRVQIHSKPI